MKKYFNEIWFLLGEDRFKVFGLFLLFLGISFLDLAGIGLIGPYISIIFDSQALDGSLGSIVDVVGLPKERDALLITMGLTLFLIFLFKAISAIWINYRIIQFSNNQQIRLRSLLMQSYQKLTYAEYLQRNSSEYIYSMQELVVQYSNQVIVPGLRTLSDGIVALMILMFLAWQNITAFILLIGIFGVAIVGYDYLFRGRVSLYGKKSNKAATLMTQGIYESIEGFKEIRILGHEKFFFDNVKSEAVKYSESQSKSQVIATAPRYLMELLLISFIVTLVIVTLVLNQGVETLLPTLGVFGVAALRLVPSANGLSSSLIYLRFGRNAVSRLYADLRRLKKSQLNLKVGSDKPIVENFRNLSLNHVNFTYPGSKKEVLKNISITINSGQSIGLIGKSGSGKTTLIDMLLGLLEPSDGSISYNGKKLSKSLIEWRNQVAYLPQQVFLMDNTLRRNIALGMKDLEIDDKRINKAIRQANLEDFVNQLPEGIETVLGERGVRLSGGQRQRIALARAFYHERKILVMDESTSSLDSETEYEIVEEIRRLSGDKTMIVIAHRITTLRHCDIIYELKDGCIINVGSYQEIIQGKL
jgi:ATP-binding cassette, subfamily B, bacterial PglK